MTSTGVQRASFDAEVRSDLPTTNLGTRGLIGLDSATPIRQGLIYFALPATLPGDTIVSATLKLYQYNAATGGSRTLTVNRASGAWTASKVIWNTRPSPVGATATRTLGDGGTNGRVWEFDVTGAIAEVAAGAPWYGFKVTSDNATPFAFHSRENITYAPTLEVVYEPATAEPVNLIPDNGLAVSVTSPILQWASVLAESIGSYRVQVATDSTFTTIVEDSGQVFSTLPQHQMTFATSTATTYYWRVKVWSGAGVASGWSDTATFVRVLKPTLTIDNPAASPNNFVTESTPPFSWTFAGQTKFQVQVWNLDDNDLIHDSGIIDGNANTYTPPVAIRFATGVNYQLRVSAWDGVARVATPGDPPRVIAVRDFTFVWSATVAPVTALTATTDGTPFLTLTFDSATAPDWFQVFSGGKPVTGRIEPADVFVSGTTYSIVVRTLDARVTYPALTVVRIVNGVTSSANPTTSGRTEPEGIWLTDTAGNFPVCINDDGNIGSWRTGEISAVHQPIGSPYSVVLWQTPRAGRNAEISGWLVDTYGDDPVTSATYKARFRTLTNPPGKKLLLTLSDTTLPVYVRNALISPADDNLYIPISFEAYERPDD